MFSSKISQVKNGASIFGSKDLTCSDKSINGQTDIDIPGVSKGTR